MIVVNFKRYVAGEEAVALGLVCKKVAEETGITIVACPTEADLPACIEAGVECWTQKYEPEAKGNIGSLLNHSDYRISQKEVAEEMEKIKGERCVCTADIKETEELVELAPDYILYEPPELIGSTSTSVTESKPEIIGDCAEICLAANVPLLVGAGIKSAADVKKSLELGAVGVGVATAVVKADNPEEKLRELAQACR